MDIRDLDVVARGVAWKFVLDLADPMIPPSGYGHMVALFDGTIEIFDRWLPGSKEPDELIEKAEIIDGIPFCPLREVLDWKLRSARHKDRTDIRILEKHLRS
ncbi:hypothetical protein [Streptomyces millisiae]|uniref:Uncharacterized protein n=1 Tax=Streptomyces millisiae TaxID=3075542 RepID=A0ABU2LKX0_9ACTN|nr:hypothetical protein [Streptomyces sp. DSM 44918]MDT0318249.1 hypothetical protein [Streptomyces sp. DSM 44918]